jgi:AcrR family transcriptional regulator
MDDARTTMRLRNSGSGRLPAEEAARLTDRLLDAATALFMERGYAHASMEGIARKAGASTKTLYGRYRNKDEILSAAIRRMVDNTVPVRIEEFDVDPDQAEPRELLTALGLKLANLVIDKRAIGFYRDVVSETPRFPELAKTYAEGSGRIVTSMTGLFERWRRTGKLPLYCKPAVAAQHFLDLIVATPRNKAVIGTPMNPQQLKAHVLSGVDVFLRGCGPQNAAG